MFSRAPHWMRENRQAGPSRLSPGFGHLRSMITAVLVAVLLGSIGYAAPNIVGTVDKSQAGDIVKQGGEATGNPSGFLSAQTDPPVSTFTFEVTVPLGPQGFEVGPLYS